MTHGDFVIMLNYWANEAEIILIVNGEIGCFTLHCFRRGGAQHQFMFAIHGKWSISAVKWWGGWSPNEKADTMIKCLLEELESDEMDFRDMFSPLRNSEKRVTFGGETEHVTKEFFAQSMNSMQSNMMRLISSEVSSLHSHLSSSSTNIISSFSTTNHARQHLANSKEQNKASEFTSNGDAGEKIIAEKQNDSSSISMNTLIDDNPIMLKNAALPHASTVEDVLLFWHKGDKEKGLLRPLKTVTRNEKAGKRNLISRLSFYYSIVKEYERLGGKTGNISEGTFKHAYADVLFNSDKKKNIGLKDFSKHLKQTNV